MELGFAFRVLFCYRRAELVEKCVDWNLDCGLIGRGFCRAI
jgi:hypothetical protein